MKINPTSLSLNQLLGAANEQYVVPPYQRRFSWKWQQLADLWDDIDILEDNDHHLLGTIVCLTGPHQAGLNQLEVVDGQQRLTALSILLYCICHRLEKEGEEDAAREVRRLLEAKPLGMDAAPKITLDSLDQEEYLAYIGGETVEEPANPHLASAFKYFKEWVEDLELADLAAFLYRLQNQTTIIRLEVSEAKDAFKLFETINNRGLQLSSTDILKNFFLGNAARFGDKDLLLARKVWTELIESLDGLAPDTFFRYYICSQLGKRISNTNVVFEFKQLFFTTVKEAASLPERTLYGEDEPEDYADDPEELDDEEAEPLETNEEPSDIDDESTSFREFIQKLALGAKIYQQLLKANTGDDALDRHLRNLQLIKASPGFIFLLGKRLNACSDKEFRNILILTEAFLVRRLTCRSRTGDTEGVFARLCKDNSSASLDEIREQYQAHSPEDERFESDFATFQYTQANIGRARYCLEKFESTYHGDYDELVVLGSSDVQVEHIIPQKIKTAAVKKKFGDWVEYLGNDAEARHSQYVSKIGNLTLFAGSLNLKASNNPYHMKCDAYKKSSIEITNTLPADYKKFDYAAVDERGKDLSASAVELWPNP